VYGLTTGVGERKAYLLDPADRHRFNHRLVLNHRIAQGDAAPADVVRGAMLCLANSYAKGVTGVRPELAEMIVTLLNDGFAPPVRRLGSIGQGDLGPMDFADAREQGRERAGSRPSRGRRGRGFRRLISGIPTGKFRDRLVQMTSNAGLAVIVVDPAYTSRWGHEHWLAPLQDHRHPVPASGHHAAAVVIGRRALGHRARRRAGVTGGGQRTSRRRATPGAPVARQTTRNGRPRQAQRQPPRWPKTATANRTSPPDQATQDRPGPPATQDHVPLAQ
jgi:hypothetical protein